MKLTNEMKEWFGDGEIDVDLIIRMGVTTESNLCEIICNLKDSPFMKKLKVANIGYIYGEHDDRWMFQKALEWLEQNDPFYEIPPITEHTNFDLNTDPPRDFLKDKNKFDVVILHIVYHNPYSNSKFRTNSYFAQSELHSISIWRKRLIETKAKYIFTFGDLDEISGETLEELPNYLKIEIDRMFTIYKFVEAI